MHILILEDEEPAARRVEQFLDDYGWTPAQHPRQVLRSVAKARQWLAANPMPDLVFSDIELLDGNVFELYRQVTVSCPIIFTTAYDQFLLEAFRVNGIAYLLKPFDGEQFRAALAKYENLQRSLAGPGPALTAEVLRSLSQALQPGLRSYRQRFSVRVGSAITLLAVGEVAYLQADEGLVFAVDKAGRRFPLPGTLTELELQLDPGQFFRINRSEVVNIAYVERAEAYFNNRLALKIRPLGTELLSSTGQTPELRKWLDG